MSFLLIMTAFGANAFEQRFAQGNAAYQSGDYQAAVQAYEEVVGEDVADPAVFYNLGNAYYRVDRLGAAIANYQRALDLDPRFESARENQAKALRDTQRNLPPPLPPAWRQSLLFWDTRIRYGTVLRLAVAGWLIFWTILGVHQWRPWRGTWAAAAVLGGGVALLGLSAWSKAHPMPLAVAARQTVAVRYGRSGAETIRFELYEGDRVKVDLRESGWARVTAVDGARGWAQEEDLILVGPPYAPPPAEPKPSAEEPL